MWLKFDVKPPDYRDDNCLGGADITFITYLPYGIRVVIIHIVLLTIFFSS